MAIFKTSGCDCCEGYAADLGRHGFAVTVSRRRLVSRERQPWTRSQCLRADQDLDRHVG